MNNQSQSGAFVTPTINNSYMNPNKHGVGLSPEKATISGTNLVVVELYKSLHLYVGRMGGSIAHQ
jgi:hypothetical protein